MGFIDKPQHVWLRRASFQVHLWLGVALAVYVIVIGVTGSILVFREDLTRWLAPPLPEIAANGRPMASLDTMVAAVNERYPGRRVTALRAPTGDQPAVVAFVSGEGPALGVTLDPYDARLLTEAPLSIPWLVWIADLHGDLLAGPTGRVVNGAAAALLLVLCASGLVIWWPGLRTWKRAFLVDVRRNWRRIVFDMHSAMGIWMLAWVVMWSATTVYFAWPAQVTAAVAQVSPIRAFPSITVPPRTNGDWPSLDDMLARARQLYPADAFAGVVLALGDDDALMFQMARGRVGDFPHTDFVYFDPSTGEHLGTYRRGDTRSVGEWLIWATYPLHFGSDWGIVMQAGWALTGLSLPALAVTGLLMYWNRYLRRLWPRL